MKSTTEILNEFIELRKDWAGVHAIDDDYLSIVKMLIDKGFAGPVENKYDLMIIYDNLVINSKIIDADNFNDYDRAYLENRIHKNYRTLEKEILENGVRYLLDFYTSRGQREECCIKL